jgi:hypothetical protein
MPPRSSPRMRRRDFIATHSVAAPSPIEAWRGTHWIEGRSFHAQVQWGRRVTARNHGAARAQAQWKSELGRGRLLPPGIGNDGRLWCRWQSAVGAIPLGQHDEWAVQHRRYSADVPDQCRRNTPSAAKSVWQKEVRKSVWQKWIFPTQPLDDQAICPCSASRNDVYDRIDLIFLAGHRGGTNKGFSLISLALPRACPQLN